MAAGRPVTAGPLGRVLGRAAERLATPARATVRQMTDDERSELRRVGPRLEGVAAGADHVAGRETDRRAPGGQVEASRAGCQRTGSEPSISSAGTSGCSAIGWKSPAGTSSRCCPTSPTRSCFSASWRRSTRVRITAARCPEPVGLWVAWMATSIAAMFARHVRAVHADDTVEAMQRVFGFTERPNLPPRYNIAPRQEVPIVRRTRDGAGRELILIRWGLVP